MTSCGVIVQENNIKKVHVFSRYFVITSILIVVHYLSFQFQQFPGLSWKLRASWETSFWKKPIYKPITFQMAWSFIVKCIIGKEDQSNRNKGITRPSLKEWRIIGEKEDPATFSFFNLHWVNRIFVQSTLVRLRHLFTVAISIDSHRLFEYHTYPQTRYRSFS